MLLKSNRDITIKDRSKKTPLLFGDKFKGKTGDFHLVFAENNEAKGLYFDHEIQRACLVKFSEEQLKINFEFDVEYNNFSDSVRDETTILGRQVDNDELITMNNLMYTFAICANIHGYFYDSRYCFGQTSQLPSAVHALFWFIQFKNTESLPIGNCAFRGRKGKEPIADIQATNEYYEDLKRLDYEPLINGLDLHEYCASKSEIFIAQSRTMLTPQILQLKINTP